MKKFIYILSALCLVLLSGCNKDEAPESVEINVISADANFSANGNAGKIKIRRAESQTETLVARSSDESILKITETGYDEVSFFVERNEKIASRTAKVFLTIGNAQAVVSILQNGFVFMLPDDNTKIQMNPLGEVVIRSYTSEYEEAPRVDIAYSDPDNTGWLDCSLEDGRVIYTAELNLTAEDRSAEVTITQVSKSGKVTIYQAAAVATDDEFFCCDANAAVSEEVSLEEFALEELPGWTIGQQGDWFSITSKTETSFSVSVEENTTGADRTGIIEIKYNDGRPASLFPVRQAGTTFDDLFGAYHFYFKRNSEDNGKENQGCVWMWDVIADSEEDEAFLVKAYQYSNLHYGPVTEGYTLKLGYVRSGEFAPKMTLTFHQSLGKVNEAEVDLWPLWQGMGHQDKEGIYIYDIVYNFKEGNATYDFMLNEQSTREDIQGFYLTCNNEKIIAWCEPDPEYGCFYIKKWGSNGSHGGFTE